KVRTIGRAEEVPATAAIAGAANAVRKTPAGTLVADMFDGEGFVRGVLRKGRRLAGASALVVGRGGVGRAIAAVLAAAGATRLGVDDAGPASAQALGDRLRRHYPDLVVTTDSNDPAGWDVVV